MLIPSWGIEPDAGFNARNSRIYRFRGGGAATLDCLDIAGGTAGSWENNLIYDGNVLLPNTGSCACYSPSDMQGKFAYMNIYTASALNQIFRFDVKNRALSSYTPTSYLQAGTAAVGCRIAVSSIIDDDSPSLATKYGDIVLMGHLASYCQEMIVQV
jgi:hypothetical protein